jgi:hypothetical protein
MSQNDPRMHVSLLVLMTRMERWKKKKGTRGVAVEIIVTR